MPLPHFELSESQYRLLAETVLAPLPDPDSGLQARQEWLARGLDPEDEQLDLSALVFLRLVARGGGSLSMRELGAAVHFRAAHEAAEERLSDVVVLADAVQDAHPRLARAMRLLAQGSISLTEALAEAGRGECRSPRLKG